MSSALSGVWCRCRQAIGFRSPGWTEQNVTQNLSHIGFRRRNLSLSSLASLSRCSHGQRYARAHTSSTQHDHPHRPAAMQKSPVARRLAFSPLPAARRMRAQAHGSVCTCGSAGKGTLPQFDLQTALTRKEYAASTVSTAGAPPTSHTLFSCRQLVYPPLTGPCAPPSLAPQEADHSQIGGHGAVQPGALPPLRCARVGRVGAR